MKKTFNVNLGGRLFQIDEDAYEQLNDYLTSIRECLGNNENCDEIVTDIEMRMGELFVSHTENGNSKIITLALVNEIIARVGSPELMLENNDDSEPVAEKQAETESASHLGEQADAATGAKKIYRDITNKIFGGVMAGLSAYFDVDVTLLRILAVILSLLSSFWVILLYLLLWAIVPPAITTADKLRMKGVRPTPENISENIVRDEPVVNVMMNNVKDIGNKGLVILLTILMCVLLVSLFVSPYGWNVTLTNIMVFAPIRLMLVWLAVAVAIGVPVFLTILVCVSKWKMISTKAKLLMFVDWVLAIWKLILCSNIIL